MYESILINFRSTIQTAPIDLLCIRLGCTMRNSPAILVCKSEDMSMWFGWEPSDVKSGISYYLYMVPYENNQPVRENNQGLKVVDFIPIDVPDPEWGREVIIRTTKSRLTYEIFPELT